MPENPFDLVFKPEYTSKLKQCGIFMLDSPSEIMPAALQYVGKDASSNNPADYTAALDMLKTVRKDVRKFGDSSVVNEIADGNLCVFLAWSGDINMAAERAGTSDIKVLLGHGGIVFFDTMAITADAKNIDQAYAWINFALDQKMLPASPMSWVMRWRIKRRWIKDWLIKKWQTIKPFSYQQKT